ncbi:MAG: endonuclease V [Promethearchaeota archaeon]
MYSKNELLQDNYSIEQAENLQIKYQKMIINSLQENLVRSIPSIETVVGVDVAYFTRGNVEFGIATAVLWNLVQEKVEFDCFSKGSVNFPYKAGFLGFRECRLLAKAILKLPYKPDLIMCDGHGKIHPRRFGEAVQLGLALGIPSIGIAKNPYIGQYKVKKFEKLQGNKIPIWEKNELLGYKVCLNDGSKPVYISEGFNITIDTAIEICLATVKRHRLPEPLYLADHLSKKHVRDVLSKLNQEFDFRVT